MSICCGDNSPKSVDNYSKQREIGPNRRGMTCIVHFVECPECNQRFSTTETASLTVTKRSGVVEAFSREKIMNGVRKACQGRPVTEADLAMLAQTVEETIRASGAAAVDANDVGLAILEPLRKLDEVAFMRFASVYQGWETLDDFEAAIKLLKIEREESATEVSK
jgi:transcriptional repressor NrdR